ncbi:hypothetical protein MP228_005388 [Amoeboaphelidium protococcarum]|nr:hypothetical protein MP228_005388 [Amoeboaphelidium protococcarum]
MGNVSCVETPDLQVHSTDKVTLHEIQCRRANQSEYKKAKNQEIYYKFLITCKFSVNSPEIETIKAVYTRDQIFDSVKLHKAFPMVHSSDLSSGFMEDIGTVVCQENTACTHQFEMMLPAALTDRMMFGFLLDENNVVMAKVRGAVLVEGELELLHSIPDVVDSERVSRRIGIERMSRMNVSAQFDIPRSMRLQNAMKKFQAVAKPKSEFIASTDGVKLSYRQYQSDGLDDQKAILVMIAANGQHYDYIASEVSKSYNIISFVLELRGFGQSGGLKGYSPTKDQVFVDIKVFIQYLKVNFDGLPVFLCGHYFQGGLVLNYLGWRQREPVDAAIFISPHFGYMAGDSINFKSLDSLKSSRRSSMNQNSSTVSSFNNLLQRYSSQDEIIHHDDARVESTFMDLASSNIAKACNAVNPKKLFEKIDTQFGFWVGECEEIIVPDKIVNFPKRSSVRSTVNIIPKASHIDVILQISTTLGEWIEATASRDVPTRKLQAGEKSPRDDESGPAPFKHPVLFDYDLVTRTYNDLKLDCGKSSFLVANDGFNIRYRVFMPQQSDDRVQANVILFQMDFKLILPWLLSCKLPVAVYAVELRGIDNSSIVHSTDVILGDIRLFVCHLKFNNPDIPLLIGGHGFGASACINYSNWRYREPVNGYLFISPLIDYLSLNTADSGMVKTHNMIKLYTVDEQKHWFNTMRSSASVKLLTTFNSALNSAAASTQNSNTNSPLGSLCQISDSSSITISQPLWGALTCKNVQSLFGNMEVPFGLYLGSEDELTCAHQFVSMVEQQTDKVYLKDLQVMRGSSHMSSLITASAHIVPFIKKFIKIVSPKLSFKMRNPKLSQFEKVQFIGRGSFGKVYLVRHIESDRYYAMKVLSKSQIFKLNEVKHVITERNILSDLNSQYVVSFVGSMQDGHNLYILMEYVIGGELFTQLTLRKCFNVDTARFYAAEVVLFLEHLHSNQIIYRDIKPENILIDAMGHIKFTDFGFAKYLRKRTFTFCGTPQYMAPEIIINAELGRRGLGYSFAVDFYSLGILIFEMLVGQTPFHDLNVKDVYRKILYGQVEFPWSMDPDAKDLIRLLLTKNPSKRLGVNGIEEIKNHKWFQSINWEQLRRREIAPPFIPRFTHAADTRNFIPWKSGQKNVRGDEYDQAGLDTACNRDQEDSKKVADDVGQSRENDDYGNAFDQF